jgi:hypothetical protein
LPRIPSTTRHLRISEIRASEKLNRSFPLTMNWSLIGWRPAIDQAVPGNGWVEKTGRRRGLASSLPDSGGSSTQLGAAIAALNVGALLGWDWFHVARRIARIEKEFLYLPMGMISRNVSPLTGQT